MCEKIASGLFGKNEELEELKLEFVGIGLSLKYLSYDIKGTNVTLQNGLPKKEEELASNCQPEPGNDATAMEFVCDPTCDQGITSSLQHVPRVAYG